MHWSGDVDARVKSTRIHYSAIGSPADLLQTLTSQLRVSNTAPLSAAVPQACALHHMTEDIVPLVPLVTHTVHHSITGRA